MTYLVMCVSKRAMEVSEGSLQVKKFPVKPELNPLKPTWWKKSFHSVRFALTSTNSPIHAHTK